MNGFRAISAFALPAPPLIASAPTTRPTAFLQRFSFVRDKGQKLHPLRTRCASSTKPSGPAPIMASIPTANIQRLQPGARFNQIVINGGICYLSGQVARGTEDGSAAAQTRAILGKIDGLLAEAGTSKQNLLSCTIWLANMHQDVTAMNAEWDAWVDKANMPVRACVESKLVDDEITVEIQATAAMPPPPRTTVVETKDAAAAVGPYNQAVKMRDGTVYISGCIGLTTAGDMAGDTVVEQFRQAMSNLRAILKASGANGEIVKTTLLLADMNDFGTVNPIYDEFFAGGPVPARACFAAKTLPKGALVEIEAIAVVDA